MGGVALLSGLLFAVWIGVCDSWIKVLARAGSCASTKTLQEAAANLWSVPSSCDALALFPGATLEPTARGGMTPMDAPLPEAAAAVWGLALLAVATVTGILVLRWSRRTRGDALALGTLWGGLALHALPRLVGPGTSFNEFAVGPVHVGLADLAILWAALWLAWRAAAELRA
ncbi:MAG: hypothetical protein AAGA54_31130 [Myxococcota bacterium]